MEKKLSQVSLLLSLLCIVPVAHASLLSDSFLGKSRGALQDSVPTWDSSDPYEVMSNPAWVFANPQLSITHATMSTSLDKKVEKEGLSQLLVFSLAQKYSDFQVSVLGFVPTGAQPIMDTGSKHVSMSPWAHATKQMLYAAQASYQLPQTPWSFGVLLPVSFNTEAETSALLKPEEIDSRATVYLKPRLTYGVGASYFPKQGWGGSLYYKEQSRSKAQASIDGNIPALSLDLYFEGHSFYGFDPRRVSLNIVNRERTSSLGMRLRFSQWSAYDAPYVQVTESSLVLKDQLWREKAKNAWDLALGWDYSLTQLSSLSMSLGYRQSPFADLKTFYDSDHYIVGAGYRYQVLKKWTASINLRAHVLSSGGLYTWTNLGVGYLL